MAVDVTHGPALGGLSADDRGIDATTLGAAWTRAILATTLGLQIAWIAALAFGALRLYGLFA
jgi:hypothetical protein